MHDAEHRYILSVIFLINHVGIFGIKTPNSILLVIESIQPSEMQLFLGFRYHQKDIRQGYPTAKKIAVYLKCRKILLSRE